MSVLDDYFERKNNAEMCGVVFLFGYVILSLMVLVILFAHSLDHIIVDKSFPISYMIIGAIYFSLVIMVWW